MPMLKDVLVQTVRQWKSGNDRGDINALIARLDSALTPMVGPSSPRQRRRA